MCSKNNTRFDIISRRFLEQKKGFKADSQCSRFSTGRHSAGLFQIHNAADFRLRPADYRPGTAAQVKKILTFPGRGQLIFGRAQLIRRTLAVENGFSLSLY